MNIEKILQNKKLKIIIKLLVPTALSLMLIIIVKNKVITRNIKNKEDKIEISKSNRTNYPKAKTIWAILEIPSVRIKTNVYMGDNELLDFGASHHQESYFPKDGGTILIAGNSAYFKNLSKTKQNDEIILKTMYGTYKYKIEKIRIKNQEELSKSIEIKNNEEKLILYTLYPKQTGYKNEKIVVYAK